MVQFLPEDILNKDTRINKVKLSFESINGLISVQNITSAKIFKLKYNFPNTKVLDNPYSLNEFYNIEEFSIKFKKQNPQGKSAFSLEQIIAPNKGLKKLNICMREEEIQIRRFLPKNLRNWNVQLYVLTVDNLGLNVPLKVDKQIGSPQEIISGLIEPHF